MAYTWALRPNPAYPLITDGGGGGVLRPTHFPKLSEPDKDRREENIEYIYSRVHLFYLSWKNKKFTRKEIF
jgi:hypothetical protein